MSSLRNCEPRSNRSGPARVAVVIRILLFGAACAVALPVSAFEPPQPEFFSGVWNLVHPVGEPPGGNLDTWPPDPIHAVEQWASIDATFDYDPVTGAYSGTVDLDSSAFGELADVPGVYPQSRATLSLRFRIHHDFTLKINGQTFKNDTCCRKAFVQVYSGGSHGCGPAGPIPMVGTGRFSSLQQLGTGETLYFNDRGELCEYRFDWHDATTVDRELMIESAPHREWNLLFAATSQGTPSDPTGASSRLTFDWEIIPANPPVQPDTFFWEGLNGAFSDESNWEPEGVPGAGNLAIFDKEQIYTVSLGSEESGRAFVERGFVSFESGSYDLGGGSQENPSLIVGNDSEDPANLFLGTELSTTFATLGRGANTRGWVRVGPSEFPNLVNSGRWTNQGRLVIGQAGSGLLSVEGASAGTPNQPTPVLFSSDEVILAMNPGSEGELFVLASGTLESPSVAVGNMALGMHGIGTLTLQDSAMSSGEVVMGVEPTGGGIAIVTNGSWQAERFVVGRRGTGIFSTEQFGGLITEGNLENIIAEEIGSTGSIALSGAASIATMPVLTVGKAGNGVFVVDDGASLLTNHLRLGREATGEGRVLVLQGGILAVSGEPGTVIIGDGSTGVNSLELEPGSQGFANSVLVGVTAGEETNMLRLEGAGLEIEDALVIGGQQPLASGFPSGALVLQRVGIILTGELIVNAGGEVIGSGVIEVTGGNPAIVTGTINPGVVVFMTGDFKQEGPAYGRGRGFDTLTIKGDVICDGSVIVMSIGGEQGGLQDRLIIEGDASFEDVAIKLEFKYGYAPREGDTIPLIEVMGDGSVMPASLEFLGLEEGFDFDIEIPGDGSVIQMRALSDGIATSFRAEDLNEDGAVNAVDVQLVINGALGLLDPLETDVNFDKVTNAVDVQLVINAALGL